MIATGCVPYDEAYCSTMLDDEYMALRKLYDGRSSIDSRFFDVL